MNDIDAALQDRVGFLVPLNKLAPERISRLLEQSDLLELRKKEVLFRQGDRDDYTFYLLDGEIEMYADDSLIKRVSGGEGASFQPLSQLQPRQMTAIAKTKVKVLRLKRSLLEQLLSMNEAPASAPVDGLEVEEIETAQPADWLMSLLQSELFTRIPPSNIQGLLDTLETVAFKRGEAVVKQGEPGDYYYAVQHGTCEVVRSGANQREVKLAELNPGDTFGEEALISGAKRNATVRMTSDGELARLTKNDFARLIKAPLLQMIGRAEADELVAGGARWLDVRFEDEHGHNGLPGSLNIPLSMLRTRMDELDTGQRYVAYCDTGGRSSAAAFLLAEKGFDVSYVEGGAVSEPVPPPPPAKPKPVAPPKTPAKGAPKAAKPAAAAPAPSAAVTQAAAETAVLEATARASSLGAEVAKANLTIEQAHKLMAEAATLKAAADDIVAQKLARERERLAAEQAVLAQQLAEAEALKKALAAQQETAAAEARRQQEEIERRNAEFARAAEARLAERQQQIERENTLLAQRLAEAEAIQASLDRQQREAEAESTRLNAEVMRRGAELEQQAQRSLAAQQEKLAQETAALSQRLAEAEKLREALARQQRAADAETAALHAEVERRTAEVESQARARLTAEQQRLEALYRQQAEQLESLQAGREAELREQLRGELARERNEFERVVARSNEELERARDERAAALAAKEAAAAEAQRVIAEFKLQQQTLLAEQQALFAKERARLREEADEIERLRAEASRARLEAEAAKAAAERELAAARARQATAAGTTAGLEIIEEIEERASAATRELAQALEAEQAAASAARRNEDELERTYDTASEVKNLLQRELDDWVDEQESLQESTLQREILSRQKEMVERIRARAAAAKAQATNHTKSLLDEIEAQLERR